ncbi:cupin domain-containing protein [Komagataeibacter medellinensis]|uniref:Acireductone dioxygenase n=1 Tax=Komagataeibacter medellinensis TaxID=1177712 RepID=A0ABQ6VXX0_9PROT|nr:cupin domain-containing protein [Komagataeibacter medellinensis]KAB8124480.1 cupin domain-containing protein [Komagataeibacter medellinensis]
MSRLRVYADNNPGTPIIQLGDPARIAMELAGIGVRFERWDAPVVPPRDAPESAVLDAYRPYLDQLMGETGAGSADVLRVGPDTQGWAQARSKYLSEHTHSEDEVRFFVHGQGDFILHVNGRVYDVRCTAGDLISVPAGISHWFDGGETPDFVTLRIFTNLDGWIAQYTGSDIATRFPAEA